MSLVSRIVGTLDRWTDQINMRRTLNRLECELTCESYDNDERMNRLIDEHIESEISFTEPVMHERFINQAKPVLEIHNTIEKKRCLIKELRLEFNL